MLHVFCMNTSMGLSPMSTHHVYYANNRSSLLARPRVWLARRVELAAGPGSWLSQRRPRRVEACGGAAATSLAMAIVFPNAANLNARAHVVLQRVAGDGRPLPSRYGAHAFAGARACADTVAAGATLAMPGCRAYRCAERPTVRATDTWHACEAIAAQPWAPRLVVAGLTTGVRTVAHGISRIFAGFAFPARACGSYATRQVFNHGLSRGFRC